MPTNNVETLVKNAIVSAAQNSTAGKKVKDQVNRVIADAEEYAQRIVNNASAALRASGAFNASGTSRNIANASGTTCASGVKELKEQYLKTHLSVSTSEANFSLSIPEYGVNGNITACYDPVGFAKGGTLLTSISFNGSYKTSSDGSLYTNGMVDHKGNYNVNVGYRDDNWSANLRYENGNLSGAANYHNEDGTINGSFAFNEKEVSLSFSATF